MRTTVTIDDELLDAAKARARERGESLGAVIEAGLRRELASDRDAAERPAVPTFTGGTGPHPGVDLTSNRALAELLDDGVELDRRR